MMKALTVGGLAVWVHAAEGSEAKARLLLIHGLSEHSGRHLGTIAYLNGLGIEVVRFDLRGSGQSGGRRQWVSHFSDYVDDTSRVYNWICSHLEPLPLFVLGHSLGGTIALNFAETYGRFLDGMILSAPAYLPGSSIPQWKIRLGKLLCPVVPWMRLPGAREKNDLARDPEVGRAFLADPLTCQFNTLRQGDEILKALPLLPSLCGRIETPVFLVHGSSDLIVRVEGSYELLRALASRDKSLHIFPGGYHEPHHDLEREEYFQLLGQWIAKRIRRREIPAPSKVSGRPTKTKRSPREPRAEGPGSRRSGTAR